MIVREKNCSVVLFGGIAVRVVIVIVMKTVMWKLQEVNY